MQKRIYNLLCKSFSLKFAKVKTPTFKFIRPFGGDRYSNRIDRPEKNIPVEGPDYDNDTLEINEVETRILKVLSNFEKIDLKNFKWEQDFKSLGLDSLDQTALLTEIEHEFTTVFEDRVFENFTNLGQVVQFLAKDPLTIQIESLQKQFGIE